jgi:hypothetical protein
MRVLVVCEFSGIVRDAFAQRGHDAWSLDIVPSERPGNHFQQDLLDDRGAWNVQGEWDLIIAHPPCTHLAVSGARWFHEKQVEQRKAIFFFMACANAPAERVAVENPVCIMSSHWRKPDQIIQPWMFGHGETKATCLWLKGLPKLEVTNVVDGREARVHRMPPGPNRARERSRTYEGIAQAMADQWGTTRQSER